MDVELSLFSNKKRRPRAHFSPEEDQQLRELVEEMGDDQWNVLAEKMRNRTPRQCRERWQKYLEPSLILNEWTEEEDILLDELVKRNGPHWKNLAVFFPKRTDVGLKNRWRMHERAERRRLLMKKGTKKSSNLKLSSECSPPLQIASDMDWLEYHIDEGWDDDFLLM
jgi:hypothetical protein